MNTTWTTRDLDIVETLTRRVGMLAIAQIASIWWPEAASRRAARRRLRRLRSAGLLLSGLVNMHPIPPLTHPLITWAPGDPAPDAEAVARLTKGRWSGPTLPHEVYVATPLSANLFGSTARGLPPLEHRDHDLLLAEVYTLYRRTRPRDASLWVGEHCLGKAGYRISDPDALLVDSDGHYRRAIESAGHYGPTRIEEFHQHCFTHDLPYELW